MMLHSAGVTILLCTLHAAAAEQSWNTLLDRGNQLTRQGRFAEARDVFEQARRQAESFGPADPRLALAWNNLGAVSVQLNRIREGERCYLLSAGIWERRGETVAALAPLTNLAAVYLARRHFAEADSLLHRVLDLALPALGPDHATTAAILTYLAGCAFSRHDYIAAAAFGERALAAVRKSRTAADPELAVALDNVGTIYRAQGRRPDSGRLFAEALQVLETSGQSDHPAWISAWTDSALALLDDGRYQEAEAQFARALALAEKILGPAHPSVAHILQDEATALRKLKRKSEAKKMEARAAAILAQSGRDNALGYTVDARSLKGFTNP